MTLMQRGEKIVLRSQMAIAGRPAEYRRGRDGWDLKVIPLENFDEDILFQNSGIVMTEESCLFLLAAPPCGEPVEGDVIALRVGETVEEYEACKDGVGNVFEWYGMNKIGVLVHCKKGIGNRG